MRRIEHTLADFPMPDSIQIEYRILASVITDTTYFSEVLRIVKREFFSSDKNRAIWDVVVDMYNKGEGIDMSTVFPKIDRKHYIDNIIGAEVAFGMSIIGLCSALYDTYIRRCAYIRSIEILQGVNGGVSVENIMTRFSDFTKEASEVFDSGSAKAAMDVANRLADSIMSGKKSRIPTPFSSLNYYTYGGLGGGNLVILAARPSVGKTTIGLQMAQCAAMNGVPTTFYSLEMTDEELVQRMIVGTGLVSTLEIVTQNVNWENYERAVSVAVPKNLTINDKAKSLDELCTNIALDAQQGKCKIAFIDYLGLIRHDDRRKSFAQVVGEITHSMKNMAMECNIPIVLLCQLNRESAKEGRSPQLTDLRDSGDIEQDADIVIMLERPKDEFGEIQKDHIDLWLRKNRGGQCNFDNAIHLVGNSSYSNFKEETQPVTIQSKPVAEPTAEPRPVNPDLFDNQEEF